MDNDLDDMLYAVYLAKLESLKGTKKPLVDFIKEMTNDTYNFYKLTYRQFKLVTIAINNCTAKHIISKDYLDGLQQRLSNLIKKFATEENILDLLEFYTGEIDFIPVNMEQFILMDKLYNVIKNNRPELIINFKVHNIDLFNKFHFLAYIKIHKHNSDSLLLKTFREPSKKELEKAKEFYKELTEILEHKEYIFNKELV